MKIPIHIIELFEQSNLTTYSEATYEEQNVIEAQEKDKKKVLISWLDQQDEPVENWQNFIFNYIQKLKIIVRKSYNHTNELEYYWPIFSQLYSNFLLYPIEQFLVKENDKKAALTELVDRIVSFPDENEDTVFIQFSLIHLLSEMKLKKAFDASNEGNVENLQYMYTELLSFCYTTVLKPLHYGELYVLDNLLNALEDRFEEIYDPQKEIAPFYKLKQVELLCFYTHNRHFSSNYNGFLLVEDANIEIPSPTDLKQKALAIFDEQPKIAILFLRLDVIYKALKVVDYKQFFKDVILSSEVNVVADTIEFILRIANTELLQKIGKHFREHTHENFTKVILFIGKTEEYVYWDDSALTNDGEALAILLLELRKENSKEKTFKNLEALLAKWNIIRPENPEIAVEIKYRTHDEANYENYITDDDELAELLETGSYSKLFFHNNKLKFIEEIRDKNFKKVKYYLDDSEEKLITLEKLQEKYNNNDAEFLLVNLKDLAVNSDKYISSKYTSETISRYQGTTLIDTRQEIYSDNYNQKMCTILIDAEGNPILNTITKFYYPDDHEYVFDFEYEELFSISYKDANSIEELYLFWDDEKAFESFIQNVYSSNMKDYRYGQYEDDIISHFQEKYAETSEDDQSEFYEKTIVHLLEIPEYLLYLEYKTADPFCLELLH